LIYLDPHFVQDVSTALTTYTCNEVRTLKLSKISTSVAIGFYIRNKNEFENFKSKISKLSKLENSGFCCFE
jgi:cysteine protease ATG4